MRNIFPLFAVMSLMTSLSAAAPTTAQPSFDCSKATTAVEQAICRNPALAEEDAAMARLYASARVSAAGTGTSGQVQRQKDWLLERSSCETSDIKAQDPRLDCLMTTYRARNAELAVGAAYADRAFALKTLYRLNAEFAPLVEAMMLYADQPPGSNWRSAALAAPRRRIEQVLAAPWAGFKSGESAGYGVDILKDSGINGSVDMFKGDHDFAYALGILGTYSQREGVQPLFPCKALLRNPQLIDIEGPFFGSTLDNFIPFSDCQTAMPPLPALDRLVKAIWLDWPTCQGTIRFSGYRGFATSVDSARIGLPIELKLSTSKFPRLRGVKPGLLSAAQAELASHYRANLHMPPARAAATAHARIDEVLRGAHECSG